MTVKTKRVLTHFTTALAVLSHFLVFYIPFIQTKKGLTIRGIEGEVLEIGPGEKINSGDVIGNALLIGAIELIAILGIITYLFVIFIGKNKKRETGTGIFIGSLLISLTVAAIMLPRSGINIIDHNNQQQFIEFIPEAGYPLWVFSLFIGGLAIHFIANLRWHIISQRDH